MRSNEYAELNGQGLRFAMVVARFNPQVTEGLASGALQSLTSSGVHEGDIDRFDVPGSFEIPFVADKLASSGKYDGIICLGAIIKGETRHDEYIAREVAHGIRDVGQQHGVPVAFGVLTTLNQEQAVARSSGDMNRGRESALAALEMALLVKNKLSKLS